MDGINLNNRQRRRNNMDNKPTFETFAQATIDRATATFGQRGKEYGDSWANPHTNMLDAVANKLGVVIPQHAKRAVLLAVLVDVKYNRLCGGYKDDTVLDGINYNAALAEEMRRLSSTYEIPKFESVTESYPPHIKHEGKTYVRGAIGESIQKGWLQLTSKGHITKASYSIGQVVHDEPDAPWAWYKPAPVNQPPTSEPESSSLRSSGAVPYICSVCGWRSLFQPCPQHI